MQVILHEAVFRVSPFLDLAVLRRAYFLAAVRQRASGLQGGGVFHGSARRDGRNGRRDKRQVLLLFFAHICRGGWGEVRRQPLARDINNKIDDNKHNNYNGEDDMKSDHNNDDKNGMMINDHITIVAMLAAITILIYILAEPTGPRRIRSESSKPLGFLG